MFAGVANLFRREKPRLSRKESLRGVPVQSPGVRSVEGPDGERMLFVPREAPFGALCRWLGVSDRVPPARLILDELGNAVWKQIDGRRNVGQIVRLFADETGLHRREAETSVVEFLNGLMRRGVISVAFKH